MQSEHIALGELILIGSSIRTNNKNEMNPETAKIGQHFHSYFFDKISDQMKHRHSPNTTYSVYTNYESNENGEYTHFIGEVVQSLDDQDLSKFQTLVIPPSMYQKFTTPSGELPNVVIEAWQKIWKMNAVSLGGKRTYIADFEVYDHRSYSPGCAIVDIFISIK